MKLIMENWREYLQEDKPLNEGLQDWALRIVTDIGMAISNVPTTMTTDKIMDKVSETAGVDKLKGENLIKFLKTSF